MSKKVSDGVAVLSSYLSGFVDALEGKQAEKSAVAAVALPWEAEDIPQEKREAVEASIRALSRNRSVVGGRERKRAQTPCVGQEDLHGGTAKGGRVCGNVQV